MQQIKNAMRDPVNVASFQQALLMASSAGSPATATEQASYAEVADRISKHTGCTVQYVDIPAKAQRKAMLDQGMPAWQVDALLDLQGYYTSGKGGAGRRGSATQSDPLGLCSGMLWS